MVRYKSTMEEIEVKEQERLEKLVFMLDHPEEYSDEELGVFFSNPDNRADYRLYRLAQKSYKHGHVLAPDVNKEWRFFRHEQIRTPKKQAAWQIWGAALLGAAAVFIGMMLFYHYTSFPSLTENKPLIAMEYDRNPQEVKIQEEGEQLKTVTQKDSISFLAPVEENILPKKNQAEVKMRTISTPRGVDFKVTLPDGTEVWLNAESGLQFPSSFTTVSRRVMLTGEAYFKVAHNEECPFIVETDEMKVRVLGTEFNFRNYGSESPSVSLVKGAISILSNDEEGTDLLLQPGQGASIGEDGRVILQEVDTYAVAQWVKGYFYFRNQPLLEVLQDLGRWYNVGVVFVNPTYMQENIHFSALRSAKLEQSIENLNRLLPARVELRGNNIIVR